MAKFVGARVYNSGNISINNASATPLTFDSERFDTDTIHNTGTNTGRLTCNTAGKYLIIVNLRWAGNATGYRMVLIKLNGATEIAQINQDALSGATSQGMSISTIYDLSATDYAEVYVYQTSGVALNVLNESNKSPEFMMHRIG